MRKVYTGSERTYFDTDTGNHQHFYIEAEDRIIDIPGEQLRFSKLPEPPEGYIITKVDVLIRLACAEPERRGCRACGSSGCNVAASVGRSMETRMRYWHIGICRHERMESDDMMSPLESLRQSLPDYARDIKLNLGSLLGSAGLPELPKSQNGVRQWLRQSQAAMPP